MSQLQVVEEIKLDYALIEQVLLTGDLSRLTSAHKIQYYNKVCETVGLNPLTKPFEYIKLNGKEILYASKGCAEQLRAIHKIGIKIVKTEKIDDVFIVTAEALNAAGRTDSATGAVNIAGLRGESLANAMMKAETKAKRRVTLSICGLNMLDESEDPDEDFPRGNVYPDQPTGDDGDAAAQAARPYTFPFGSFKAMQPMEAFQKLGREKLENALTLIEEKLGKNETYKNVTAAQMTEAKLEIERVISAFENGELTNEQT